MGCHVTVGAESKTIPVDTGQNWKVVQVRDREGFYKKSALQNSELKREKVRNETKQNKTSKKTLQNFKINQTTINRLAMIVWKSLVRYIYIMIFKFYKFTSMLHLFLHLNHSTMKNDIKLSLIFLVENLTFIQFYQTTMFTPF